ncbi:PucR family transcriptional regulator [Nocardioides ginsengisoli]|uniref:PucR family transcriptional regulator n=1 Tax=Nocardioides ginsengisoli TaxID=363868 RepID=A0ABW3VYQ3_9ACTN
MTTPQDLVDARHLDIGWVAGTAPGRPVTGVRAAERLADVADQKSGRVVVLTAGATEHASPYELDVATRLAATQECAALLFVGDGDVPSTCRRMAERTGLVLLATPATTDIARLIIRLDRLVTTTAAVVLERLAAAHAAVADDAASADELLARAQDALGVPVELEARGDEATERRTAGSVVIGDQVIGVVRVPSDEAAQLALPTIAAAVARAKQRELTRLFAETQTRAELVAQVAFAESSHLPSLVEQARRVGFRVDGHHCAAWLDFGELDAADADGLAQRRRLVDRVELAGLHRFSNVAGSWHLAAVTGHLLVVGSTASRLDRLVAELRAGVEHLVAEVTPDAGGAVYVGIGGPWEGVDGLRSAVTEARVASRIARDKRRSGRPVMFDGTGIRRVLAELAASTTSRKVLDEVLAPLDALGPDRASQGVETLLAYLDAQRSPTKAAATLHLHPNAVTYRIRRLVPLLDLDLDNPDDRFALHLACRVRVAG